MKNQLTVLTLGSGLASSTELKEFDTVYSVVLEEIKDRS